MRRLDIARWWAWVRGPGEDLGRGRRGEGEEGRLSAGGVSAGLLVLGSSSSLLGMEWPEDEIRGDMGDQSMCSLPSGDSDAGLDGTGGWDGVSGSESEAWS